MAKRDTTSDEAVATAEDRGISEAAVESAEEQQNQSVQAVQDAQPVATDRVALISLRADLSPDQTEGYEVIGDRELAREDLKERLREQSVSNADFAARTALTGVDVGTVGESPGQDPIIQALQDKHESAAGDVEGRAAELVPDA